MLRREGSTGVENLPELVISSCRFSERISVRKLSVECCRVLKGGMPA